MNIPKELNGIKNGEGGEILPISDPILKKMHFPDSLIKQNGIFETRIPKKTI